MDWERKSYLGLTLDWDYSNQKVHLSMPGYGYISDVLKRFKHEPPPKNIMIATQTCDTVSVRWDKPTIHTGAGQIHPRLPCKKVYPTSRLHNARPPKRLASEQANPTQKTMEKVKQFLDYAASQENAILTYHASDMQLAPKACSRAGGHFYDSKHTE